MTDELFRQAVRAGTASTPPGCIGWPTRPTRPTPARKLYAREHRIPLERAVLRAVLVPDGLHQRNTTNPDSTP